MSKRLIEVDRELHVRVNDPSDPLGFAKALDDVAQDLLDEGAHFIRVKDTIIMFLDGDGEVHFVPGPEGIYGVTYDYET
ncbi:hypothetical protein [Paenibacillus elgii]|uniref:hypothetical protein n=1 Tax=Paenibacillus elgii TaxID=189691 RepID=UPI0013D0C877|nr:hypothetical protein [Paenibacillus elgii]